MMKEELTTREKNSNNNAKGLNNNAREPNNNAKGVKYQHKRSIASQKINSSYKLIELSSLTHKTN